MKATSSPCGSEKSPNLFRIGLGANIRQERGSPAVCRVHSILSWIRSMLCSRSLFIATILGALALPAHTATITTFTGGDPGEGLYLNDSISVAEYYSGSIVGLMNVGSAAFSYSTRLGSSMGVTGTKAEFGSTTNDNAIETICGSSRYKPSPPTPSRLAFSVPTISNELTRLQLIFHDNQCTSIGVRILQVKLAGITVVSNLDLVAQGAYGSQPKGVVVSDVFTAASNTLPIEIIGTTGNAMLNALTVSTIPIIIAPSLKSAITVTGSRVCARFSGTVTPITATRATNYFLSGGAAVIRATLAPDNLTVTLETTGLTNSSFTLAASNIYNPEGALVTSNTVVGVNLAFTSADIGGPVPAGTNYACTSSEVDVEVGGSDTWGTEDQLHFLYKSRTGDFDMVVQIPSVITPNAWARSGIMARDTTNSDSRQLLIFAAPSTGQNQYVATVRRATGSITTEWGTRTSPAAFPNVFLRLRRAGDEFVAWHSTNTTEWTRWTTTTFPLPANLLVGLATSASSGGNGTTTHATYAGYGDFAWNNAAIAITAPPVDVSVRPGQSATFSVTANAYSGVTTLAADELVYQWQRDGTNIPGASASTCTLANTMLSDAGSHFRCLLRMAGASMTTSNALLTVLPDTIPPQPVYVSALGSGNQIMVNFDEVIDPSSATNLVNYTISTGAVTSVTLLADNRTVALTVRGAAGDNFNLAVSGVRDPAGNALNTVNLAGRVQNKPRPIPNVSGADCVVTFNEIMYHPLGGPSSEWIELHNQMDTDIELDNWRLAGAVDFTFPSNTILYAGKYLLVAATPEMFGAGTFGPWSGSLNNGGERLVLLNNNERLMDEISWRDQQPWPVAADGSGASLAKIKPRSASAPPENWRASRQIGGTPGSENLGTGGFTPSLVTPASAVRVLIPDSTTPTNAWMLPGFDDSAWLAGTNGVGYDTGAAATGRPSPFVPAQLIRYYPVEGSAVDDSGSRINGTLIGGPTFSANRPAVLTNGLSLSFDGVDDFVEIMDPATPTAYTLAAWVRFDTVRSSAVVTRTSALGPAAHFTHQIMTDASGHFVHYIYDGASKSLTGSTVAQPGIWYHVVATATNGGSAFLYVNGVQEGTPIPVNTLWTGGDRWDLGVRAGNTATPFIGRLDDVCIWDRPLNATQILSLARGASPFSWNPLTNLLTTDVRPAMSGVNSCAYLRLPFHLASPGILDQLTLTLRHEDGCVVWLNGVEVARRNAPATLAWNSAATTDRSYIEIFRPETIDLTPFRGALVTGKNVLAIQGLSTSASNATFLTLAELTAHEAAASTNVLKLALSEVSSVTNAPFWLELQNYGSNTLDLGGCMLVSSTGSNYTLASQSLAAGAFAVVTATQLGWAPASTDKLFLISSGAGEVLDGTSHSQLLRGRVSPTGPFLHPSSPTPGASNVFNFTTEIVINEINYHHRPDVTATSYVANAEEWIELYNRGTQTVNLAGWRFNDAVQFTLPTGTVLAPDNYLVVARDAAALSAKHPGITILGDFSGSLNAGEQLTLLDANDNPADEVRFFRNKPWPIYTDGGGSSLELKNAWADNSRPEAWGASDETTNSVWQHYETTVIATNPVFNPNIYGYSELRLCLLKDGEALVDNVSVIEDPGGANREFIQNGSFNNGANTWRLQGTHRHSFVETNGVNPCLHVVSTGDGTYLLNLIETTFKYGGSYVPVSVGRRYKISFDAKWLAGSPRLRAEFHSNKAAVQFTLAQPSISGTPGRRNSCYVPNLGPTFSNLTHSPVMPSATSNITVSVDMNDRESVASATLWYSVNAGSWKNVPMTTGPSSVATHALGTIPGQPSSSKIQFYVQARDGLGASSFFPAGGSSSRALIQVQDGLGAASRQNFRITMLDAERDWMTANANILSDDRLGATVVYNESEVAYDCGVRLRGSMYSRQNPTTTGFNVIFPADQPFRGIHTGVTMKRAGNAEEFLRQLMHHAGGIPDMYDDMVNLIMPVLANRGPGRLSMAGYGDVFLDSQYENGASGILGYLEGIRIFVQPSGSSPEAPKTPTSVDFQWDFDLTDLGPDKEQYRWPVMLGNNSAHDDFSPLIAMCQTLALSGDTLQSNALPRFDIDEWARLLSLETLAGIGDSYGQGASPGDGNPHNMDFYQRATDNKMLLLPWDWDFTFSRAITSAVYPSQNVGKLIALPANLRLMHGHLRDLVQRSMNVSYATRWAQHYSLLTGEDLIPYLTYIQNRAEYCLSVLPATVPFTIESNAGINFSTNASSVTLTGRGSVDVAQMRLSGDDSPLAVTWLDGERWQLTRGLAPGANVINIAAFDRAGRLLGTDQITVTSTLSSRPQHDYLRITELNYHPYEATASELAAGIANADDFEFIELMNIGHVALDLSGAQFTVGISYTFTNLVLASQERIVLTKNPEAFTIRYGTNPSYRVVGGYDGNLSNGGERLLLVDHDGVTILDFTYKDSAPWPTAADGNGPSLEVFNVDSDYNSATNWHASVLSGGSPGSAASIFPVPPHLFGIAIRTGQQLSFSFTLPSPTTYRVEFKSDVHTLVWSPLITDKPGNGTVIVSDNPGTNTQRFYRVVLHP